MMKLLALPPELLEQVLSHALPLEDPLTLPRALSLCLVHPRLTPLVRAFVWRSLTLRDAAQIDQVLASPHLEACAHCIRSLRFVPPREDGGIASQVGRLGTAETVDGPAVTRLLLRLKELWSAQSAEDLGLTGGIIFLDIASVDSLRPEVLEGNWLSDVRALVLGPGFVLPTSRTLPLAFSFRLESLTLRNTHWQYLPPELLSAFLRAGLPQRRADGWHAGLKHLDLSGTYDVAGFDPFLQPSNSAFLKENDFGYLDGANVLETVESLLLPPFETAAHRHFGLAALSRCSPAMSTPPPSPLMGTEVPSTRKQHLRYLELPPLSSATSGTYDTLWAALEALLRGPSTTVLGSVTREDINGGGGLVEVGLRGWPTTALVETAQAVLAAAGLDSPPAPDGAHPPPRRGGVALKRLRFVRLLVPEELGKLPGGRGAELLYAAERSGIEIVCGPKEIVLP
ncbi:uncharacterized protein JCM10292_005895 [Rhodotorula paludigena]|uniref:uncharacterized protein n=1 Tax=Rhodotorula paludigena TaxID=86838 RepID=UPI0031732DCE